MKWSLLVGRFFGTEIRLHASLLLLIPYALITFRPEDVPGAARVMLLIAAIFACVGLHEIGHTIAARFFGIHVNSIVLWPLGGFANLSRRPEKTLHDIIISAAGPFTNLIIFLFFALLSGAVFLVDLSMALPGFSRLIAHWDVLPFLLGLTVANFSLALFNLVPIYPLDGGQITRGLLKMLIGERRADMAMMLFSIPLSLGLLILGWVTGDVAVLLTGLLMVLAGATLNAQLVNTLLMGGLFFLDRGGYYLKRQDYDPAIREYTRSIERSPNRAGLYTSRATAWMMLGVQEKALADVDCAIHLNPKSHTAWGLRGELMMMREQLEEAMRCFDRALQIRPQWSTGMIDRAGVFMEREDLSRAMEEMNRAVEVSHGSPVPHLMRSMLRHKTGDMEGARKDAEAALRYAPQWMLVFPEVFLDSLKDHLAWAENYYGLAIERYPNAYQSYQGRGDALRVHAQWARAVEDYHRAIHLAPKQAEIYISRGRALARLGMAQQAAEDFRFAAQNADRAHLRRIAATLLAELAQSAPPPAAG